MMKYNSGDFVEYIHFYKKYYECLEVVISLLLCFLFFFSIMPALEVSGEVL